MFWKYLFLGFIVCFPVQAQENANGVSERNNYELFIIGVAIYLLFKAVGVIWHYRCPKCKKWWVMRQEKKELLNTDVMTESRKEEIKDNNGNVLRVEEVKVPVLVHHYEIWRKCKHCGHLVKILKTRRKKNITEQRLNNERKQICGKLVGWRFC